MFLELKEVKNLGLEEVSNATLDVQELFELISLYQCSIELMSDLNANVLKYACLNKDINFEKLMDDLDEQNLSIWENIKLNDAINELSKYMYFSIEGKYSNNEELYPKIELLINISEFKTKANEYLDIISDLDSQAEEGKISSEEYNSLVDTKYLEHGCNIYHEKYLNETKYTQCIDNDDEIKDYDYIAGFVKLYINPSEQDKITKYIDNIIEVLQKSYVLQYK